MCCGSSLTETTAYDTYDVILLHMTSLPLAPVSWPELLRIESEMERARARAKARARARRQKCFQNQRRRRPQKIVRRRQQQRHQPQLQQRRQQQQQQQQQQLDAQAEERSRNKAEKKKKKKITFVRVEQAAQGDDIGASSAPGRCCRRAPAFPAPSGCFLWSRDEYEHEF